jgi:uncharacterized phage protein gp47/JayE
MALTQFLKDLDSLIQEHLTDFSGQFENADVSEGSPFYLLANVLASPEWGQYKKLNWLAKQFFISSCDNDILPLHGGEYGIAKNSGESWSSYRQRLLTRKRNPVSALNAGAWIKWAEEITYDHGTYVESVKTVNIYQDSLARGMGTVNVVITSTRTAAQGGEEEATAELLAAIMAGINAKRSPGFWDFLVIGATKKTIDISMTTTGSCNTEKTETDIAAFMKTSAVARPLFLDQVRALAIANGAESAPLSDPLDNVTMQMGPLVYERMWPGTIEVT